MNNIRQNKAKKIHWQSKKLILNAVPLHYKHALCACSSVAVTNKLAHIRRSLNGRRAEGTYQRRAKDRLSSKLKRRARTQENTDSWDIRTWILRHFTLDFAFNHNVFSQKADLLFRQVFGRGIRVQVRIFTWFNFPQKLTSVHLRLHNDRRFDSLAAYVLFIKYFNNNLLFTKL